MEQQLFTEGIGVNSWYSVERVVETGTDVNLCVIHTAVSQLCPPRGSVSRASWCTPSLRPWLLNTISTLKYSLDEWLILGLGQRSRRWAWNILLFHKAGVPKLWDLMPDGLRWSWCNYNRNKVHNKCHVLESSPNHPHPPWKSCLPWKWSLVPKELGITAIK